MTDHDCLRPCLSSIFASLTSTKNHFWVLTWPATCCHCYPHGWGPLPIQSVRSPHLPFTFPPWFLLILGDLPCACSGLGSTMQSISHAPLLLCLLTSALGGSGHRARARPGAQAPLSWHPDQRSVQIGASINPSKKSKTYPAPQTGHQ